MDQYGKHLLLVAVMIGAATLSASLCADAAPAEEPEPAVYEVMLRTAPEAVTRQAQAPEESAPWGTVSEESADENWLRGVSGGEDPAQTGEMTQTAYYVMLRTEPEAVVLLLEKDGTVLQCARADTDGDVTFSPVVPGQYRVRLGDADGTFLLRGNAAVEALAGALRSDGELLYIGRR